MSQGFQSAALFASTSTTTSTTSATSINVNDSPYNAVPDGKIIYDAAINSSSTQLVSASGRFTSSDVGKIIRVEGAGAAGAALSTTIAAYVSTTNVTLAAAASSSVSAKIAVWGTDNTAKIQAAVNALKQGVQNTGNATLMFGYPSGGSAIYLVSDTIDFGTSFDGATITSPNWGYVNGDVAADLTSYQNTSIRWAGADGTGKPIFWFKEGCGFNTISNLGFYGGDEAIRFRWQTSNSGESGNRIKKCSFSKQAVASIMIGDDLSNSATTGQDLANYAIEDCVFYEPNYGVVLNDSNGYSCVIQRTFFYSFTTSAAQRGVIIGKWQNVSFNDVSFLATAPSSNYKSGAYGVEATTQFFGWFDMQNIYAEIPTVAKIVNSATFALGAATLKNVHVNTSLTSGSAALDMGVFTTMENVAVSCYSGSAIQRTINLIRGGIQIGPASNVAQGGGAVIYDNFTTTQPVRIGSGFNPGTSTSYLQIPNNTYIAARNVSGTNQFNSRLIGIDSSNNVRLATDGNQLVMDGYTLFVGTGQTGTATLAAGTVTVSNTQVSAGSILILSRKTLGAAPGFLSYTLNAGVGFTITSSSGTDTGQIAWMLIN